MIESKSEDLVMKTVIFICISIHVMINSNIIEVREEKAKHLITYLEKPVPRETQ